MTFTVQIAPVSNRNDGGNAASLGLTLAGATAGDAVAILLVFQDGASALTISSVACSNTGGAESNLSAIGTIYGPANASLRSQWYLLPALAHSGDVTVTANFSGGTVPQYWGAIGGCTIRNSAGSVAFDAANITSGGGSSGSSVAVTTTAANDAILAFSCCVHGNGIPTGFNWTGLVALGGAVPLDFYSQMDGGAAGARTITAADAYESWTAGALALKAAAGGGGPGLPTVTSCTPSDGFVNSTQRVAIVGTNLATPTAVSVSGTNVTATVVGTPTSTGANIDLGIGSGATPGTRTLTYTTAGGSATVAVTINARSGGGTGSLLGATFGSHPLATLTIGKE